jgi:hypothetical protein
MSANDGSVMQRQARACLHTKVWDLYSLPEALSVAVLSTSLVAMATYELHSFGEREYFFP